MTARLIVRSPGAPRQDVSLERPVFALGRNPDCDLVLNAKYISRVHARIERKGDDEYVLIDQGSTNGTFVNGRRVAGSQTLASGDHIALADVSITFLDSASSDATRTVPVPDSSPVRCDAATREAWVNGEKIVARLSVQEFELLLLLSSQYGRVCPRDELAMAIWGEGSYEYNMLHRLVHRLKRKLGTHHDLVRSVAGVGYIIGADAEE